VSGPSRTARGLRAVPLRPRVLKRWVSLLAGLSDLGWQASARANAPIDAGGAPLPWYTYPAILWLEPRLPRTARVFEYGAGNSTLWYAARAAQVTSVDHDRAWIDSLQPRVPGNVQLLQRDTLGDDAEADEDDPYVVALEDPAAHDVVVIDGRARIACARHALPRLAPEAIAIVDNADRTRLAPLLALAGELGLQRIDFSGPVPGTGRLSTTTVLGRDLRPWLEASPPLPQLGYDGT
jgi:hypothetical protein